MNAAPRFRPAVAALEARLTPAADPLALTAPARAGAYAVGADAGDPGTAALYNPDGAVAVTGSPFGGGFAAGVRVAVADVDGDGAPDLVAAAGPGGGAGPAVRVYSGATGKPLADFLAYEAGFDGGVNLAAADLTGDGRAEVLTGADVGGGPRVRVFDGAALAAGRAEVRADFLAIDDPNFRGGVRLAVGDVTGDGVADLVAGAGEGGGPRVAGFDGRAVGAGRPERAFADFYAFEGGLRNGTFLAVGDVDGDGQGDLIFGGGPGGGPRVRAADGARVRAGGFAALDDAPAGTQLANFFAGPAGNRRGVRVGVVPAGGRSAIVAADVSGGAAQVFNPDGTVARGLPRPGGGAGVNLAGPAFDSSAAGVRAATTQFQDGAVDLNSRSSSGRSSSSGGGRSTGLTAPGTGTYAVRSVDDFDSDPRYYYNNAQRVAGLQLVLASRSRFALAIPNTTASPFSGTYSRTADGALVLTGGFTSSYATSTTQFQFYAEVAVKDGAVRMYYRAGSGVNAAAVVNRGQFGASNGNYYEALLTLG